MWRCPSRICLLTFVVQGLVSHGLLAQDSHYWSHHYGGRAILLTGAVVGGINDPSAAYYNPAGLAFATEDEIFLGTQVFDLTNIRIETETGTETTLDSDDLGRAPSFLGGMVPLGLKKHRFAYAIFKRHSFEMRVDGGGLVTGDDPNGGTPTAYSRITFDANLSERWFGGSWAYPFTPAVSMGISTFIARRNQILEIDRTAQGFSPPATTIIANQTDYYKFRHFRMLWKVGAELDLDQISFGLTVTTPGVKLYGKGERIVDEAESLSGIEGQSDFLAADYQQDVEAAYKSPWSAALGLSMFFGERALHSSVEVFEEIPEYQVLDLQPAFSQSNGLPIDNDITSRSEGVVNASVGYEEYISQDFTAFLSVSTDYSSAPPEEATNLSVTRWDLYHLTGGATFGVGTAQFIVGLGYSFGSENSTRIAAPQEDGLAEILGDPVPSEIEFQRFKIILGFSLST